MAVHLADSHSRLRAALRITLLAAITFSLPAASEPDQMNALEAIQIVTSVNNGSAQTMSREEAAQLFLGYRNRLADGTLVMLVDLPVGPIRNRFYKQLTNKNPVQVRATWSRLVFSGRVRPPVEASNPNEALEWVANTPNTIGYLPANIQDERIKTLFVVSNN